MIDRRTFIGTLAGGILASPFVSFAQQPTMAPRIGVLMSETPFVEGIRVEALRAGLQDRGYVEGTNVAIELRSADGVYDRLPGLAADLVRLNVDVLVALE